jgi:heavy metal efflux system protein
MLNGIIEWSLRNRLLVVLGSLVFVALGLFALRHLTVDAFPDTTPVQVQVNVTAPGLGPEDVEAGVTRPVEQALAGLPRLEELRSLSKFGLSQTTLVFEDGTDIYLARQLVSERLGGVELHSGAERPKLGPVATGSGEVLHYTVSSPRRDPADLRGLQDWRIRPGLRTVAGTAEVNSWGGQCRQYQVRVDPLRLHKYGVTYDQVRAAVRDNNLNVGGGFQPRNGEMFLIQGLGRTATTDDVGAVVVARPRPGSAVYVRDVAEVVAGEEVRVGGVTAQGRGETVLGLGFMLVGENSHDVTGRLKDRLAEVKKTLPEDVEVKVVYDRTRLVDQVLDTVRANLFEGGLLVVAVLFVFLGNLRAGLITALAIPLSLLFAFLGMWRFGIAGSLLSLGAIDFGLVVDSSVVMVENCVRRLAGEKDPGRSKADVIRDAALEVRLPTMFGELIIMIVYLPILTLEGVEGKLFRPMALTVVFALLGSLVLSLTLMPVLASLFLPRRVAEREPWVVRLARWLYRPVLRLALRHGTAVLLLALAALAAGVVLARGLETEFVPRLSEGALVVNVVRLPGTDLDESMRLNGRMERMLLAAFPDEVENVWSRVGTAEVATDPMGPEETDFFITLTPRERWKRARTQDELTERIRALFEDIPGQQVKYTQPIEQRVNEMVSGSKAAVAVKLYGDDYEKMQETAERIKKVLEGVPGARDVSVEQVSGQPTLQVVPRQERELARYGLSKQEVLEYVRSLSGSEAGELLEAERRVPLVVRLPERYRTDARELALMEVVTPTGERVPLGRLAELRRVERPAKILREQGQRRLTVECNVEGRGVGTFVAEARARVERDVRLPEGRYRVEWGGQFEQLERAQARLMIVVPAALFLILVLLYLTYRHVRDVLIVFTAVPFAGVGGVLALWLRGLPFSISAGVGFVALAGVSVLNSMVLVTFIRQLLAAGRTLDRAVEEAALTRLRPVLMTALVASLGFLPMALSTGVGAEVQRPLATVVIGGVLSSTLLTLLVLPVLYHFFGPKETTA